MGVSAMGQTTSNLEATSLTEDGVLSLLPYMEWTSNNTLEIEAVQSDSFKPLQVHQDTIFNRGRSVIWTRFNLDNNTGAHKEFYLSFSSHEKLSTYKCLNSQCALLGSSGTLTLPQDRMISKDESHLKLDLAPNERAQYYTRIESYRLSEGRLIVPSIQDYKSYQISRLSRLSSLTNIKLLLGLFVGAFLAFLIYPIDLFVTNKKKYYLFYTFHIVVVLFSIILRSEIDLNLDLFFSFHPNFSFGLYHVCALFSIPFYILFVESFLDLKKVHPRLYVFVNIIFWIAICIILTSIILNLFFKQYYLSHDIVLLGKIVSMLAGVVCFIVLIRDDRVSKYLAIGTLFLVLGAIVTNVLRFKHISAFNHLVPTALDWNLLYVHLGIVAEFIFFSLALGHNQHLAEREKEKALKNWISQLKENESIQENYKTKLEEDVKLQTNKILKIIKTLEEQERTQMESDFNKKLVDLELKALRAQMNPHFIFNSMNSIKHLIQKNDDERALDYLSRFSRLLRKSLQNVSMQEITLEEEIDFCTLYLEIESLRFDDAFKFHLLVDPQIDTSFITIPPLMLQPYLENSLWHGLMHKDGNRQLNLFVLKKEGYICEIIIDDNGIGRVAAEKIKGARDQKRKSLGMKLTEERLKLTKERNNMDIQVIIEDKKDDRGQASGTAVHLLIK